MICPEKERGSCEVSCTHYNRHQKTKECDNGDGGCPACVPSKRGTEKAKYLGDNVTAIADHTGSIWLYANDPVTDRICLEPAVLRALIKFAEEE